MSCPLIIVLLTLAAMASVMAQSSTLSTTSTTPATPSDVERSCKALDQFNNTALMEAKTFTRNLDECTKSNGTETLVAAVLVDLFRKLKGHEDELVNLTDYPEILRNISSCAHDITGFDFTEPEMRKHFGLPNNTVTFKFEIQQCKNSLKVMDCVENVYTGHLNATTKAHKNVFMRLFDGIAPLCEDAWIRDDINSGQYSLPSFTLILGSALMTLKLIL